MRTKPISEPRAQRKARPVRRTRAAGMQPSGDFIEQASERATALILERGYDNTPMSAIARALGLTKAGVYHHFDSKEDVLYAVHRRSIDSRLMPVLTNAEKVDDPEQRLRTFVHEFALLMTRDPSARILINEARRLSSARFAEIRSVWKRVYRLVRDAIAELQKSGRCRADLDAGFAAFAALGMCGWILYWFDYDRPGQGEEIAKTIDSILFLGILSPQAAHR